jgi:SAM-dependent methyltransferase
MNADRLRDEQAFHDAQAQARAEHFAQRQVELHFADTDYLDHETWVRPAWESLGSLDQMDALDYGCGHGMAAVVLARAGARVTAFDLSPGYVAEAEMRAKVNGVKVRGVVANGEQLPFASASFDRIWGHAILHHLELQQAGAELARVLRPGGRAVFCEPWGGNPLLRFARQRLPYPGKHRTADERPLESADLNLLRQSFPQLEVRGYQLLGMVRRALPARWRFLANPLVAADRHLLQHWRGGERWCRYMVLICEKPAAAVRGSIEERPRTNEPPR